MPGNVIPGQAAVPTLSFSPTLGKLFCVANSCEAGSRCIETSSTNVPGNRINDQSKSGFSVRGSEAFSVEWQWWQGHREAPEARNRNAPSGKKLIQSLLSVLR